MRLLTDLEGKIEGQSGENREGVTTQNGGFKGEMSYSYATRGRRKIPSLPQPSPLSFSRKQNRASPTRPLWLRFILVYDGLLSPNVKRHGIQN